MNGTMRFVPALLLLACVGNANAALIGSNGEIVTPDGVWGLEYEGVVYDVLIGDQDGKTIGEVFAVYGLTEEESAFTSAINGLMIDLFNEVGITGASAHHFFNGCEFQEPPFEACFILSPSSVFGMSYSFLDQPKNTGGTQQFWSSDAINAGVGGSFTTDGLEDFTMALIQVSEVSVPEPGTLALLGLGLVGMAARRRKKV